MSKRSAAGASNHPDSASASSASATAAAAAAASVSPPPPPSARPSRYSGDAGERAIAALRAEAKQLERERERGNETTAARLRAQEVQQELADELALLKQYRRDQSDLAIAALAVMLLLALIWVLAGWDSPIKWMEALNKEQRHQHMRDYRQP